MPLVPAKCTICGALLNIDSSNEAAVCPSCGNAFVVEKAINNYVIHNSVVNNITSDNVVVNVESEKERLNTSAETYIKLGDIQKALATYQELVEKFPDDWRGWWGTIYYSYGYKNIMYLESTQYKLNQKMALFEKIAPTEEFQKLDKIMAARLEEMRAAIEKRKLEFEKRKLELKSELSSLVDKSISTATQQIEEKTQQLLVTQENYDTLNSELQQAISVRELIEADDRKMRDRKDKIESIPYLGVFGAIIFGILGLLDGAEFSLVLVGCLFVGTIVFGFLLLITSTLRASIVYPTEELNEAKSKEKNVQERVNALYTMLKNQEREIELWNKRRNYMNENKEDIVTALFGMRSQNIFDYIDEKLDISNFS